MKTKTVLELSKPLLNLDGTPIEGSDMGKALAQVLASQTKGDPLKFYSWAVALYRGETLELDASDLEVFKAFIKDSEQMAILLKAQLLGAVAAA